MAKELSEEWIKYADEDEKMAELALQGGGPANQICFHCQQQAEKYLKAYLALKDARFEKSHQLKSVNPIERNKINLFKRQAGKIEEIKKLAQNQLALELREFLAVIDSEFNPIKFDPEFNSSTEAAAIVEKILEQLKKYLTKGHTQDFIRPWTPKDPE